MPTPPKTALRRTIKPGTRVHVQLTRAEANMLNIEDQIPMGEYDDEGPGVTVVGDVVFAEAYLHLIHIAVGNHVLRLPWSRVLSRRPRTAKVGDGYVA